MSDFSTRFSPFKQVRLRDGGGGIDIAVGRPGLAGSAARIFGSKPDDDVDSVVFAGPLRATLHFGESATSVELVPGGVCGLPDDLRSLVVATRSGRTLRLEPGPLWSRLPADWQLRVGVGAPGSLSAQDGANVTVIDLKQSALAVEALARGTVAVHGHAYEFQARASGAGSVVLADEFWCHTADTRSDDGGTVYAHAKRELRAELEGDGAIHARGKFTTCGLSAAGTGAIFLYPTTPAFTPAWLTGSRMDARRLRQGGADQVSLRDGAVIRVGE